MNRVSLLTSRQRERTPVKGIGLLGIYLAALIMAWFLEVKEGTEK